MYITATAPTLARRLVVDISYPVFFAETAILIPFPRENGNVQNLILVLQPKVVLCLILAHSY